METEELQCSPYELVRVLNDNVHYSKEKIGYPISGDKLAKLNK